MLSIPGLKSMVNGEAFRETKSYSSSFGLGNVVMCIDYEDLTLVSSWLLFNVQLGQTTISKVFSDADSPHSDDLDPIFLFYFDHLDDF